MEEDQKQQTLNTLTESEMRYRMLFESASDAIFTMEKDRFIECNKMTLKMFGCKPKDIIGHTPWEFSPKKQPDGSISEKKAKDLISAAYKGNVQRFYWKHTKLDKTPFDAEVSLNLMTIGDRKFLQAIVRDITERKHAEDSLLRLTSILENTTDFVGTAKSDTELMYINSAGKKLIGWKKDEGISKKTIKDVHPKWASEIIQNEGIPAAIEKGFWRGETAVLHTDGTEIPVSQVIMSHKSPSGEIEYLSTIMRDISKEKEAEEKLKKSEEWFRALIENSASVYSVVDEKGNAIYQSPSLERVYGWTPQEVKGKPIFERIHPDDVERVREGFKALFEKPGKIITQEVRYKHKNGTWLTIEALGVNHRDNPAIKGITITSHDITKRKNMEQKLSESEEKYRNIIEQSTEGLILLNEKGIIIDWNNAQEVITGIKSEEVLGKPFWDVLVSMQVDDGNIEYQKDELKKMILDGTKIGNAFWMNKPNQRKIRHKDGSIKIIESLVFPITTSKGLMLGSINRDITERKKTEEALSESEEKLRSILESSPDAITVTDLSGKIIECNQATLDLHGFSKKEEVLGKNSFDFIAPEERKRAYKNLEKTIEDGYMKNIEYTILKKDSSKFQGELSVQPILDSTGKPKAFVGITKDITERMRAEETIREGENKWRSLIENTSDFILIVDKKGVIRFINRIFPDLGLDDVIDKKIYDFQPPESQRIHKKILKRVFQTGNTESFEAPSAGPDSSLAWYETKVVPIKREQQVVSAMLIGTDITERKKAEEAIKESEEKFRNIVQSTPMGMHMYQLEQDGGLVFAGANPAADRILGVDNQQFVGKTIEEAFPPLKDTVVPEKYKLAAEKGGGWDTEQIDYEDEKIKGAFEVHAFQTSQDKMVALFRDITKKKQTEEKLKESEERFRSLVETAPSVILHLSPEGKILEWNPEAERLYGRKRNEVLGMNYIKEFIPKEIRETVSADIKKVLGGKPTRGFENPIISPDGNKRSMVWNVDRMLDSDGKSTGIIAVGQDITERMKAEEALKESEERFRSAFDYAVIGRGMAGLDGNLSDVNAAFCKILGYKEEELLQKTWMDITHPGDLEESKELTIQMMEQGKSSFRFIHRLIHKNGDIIWVDLNVVLIRDKSGNPLYVVGDIVDITEQKKAEEALRESEKRFRAIFDQSAQLLTILSPEGKILEVNEKLAQLPGFNPSFIGKPYWDEDFWPDSPELWDFIHDQVIKTSKGEFVSFEAKEVHDDILHVTENIIFPIKDDKGEIMFLVAGALDITERKKAEEALRESEEKYRDLVENINDAIYIVNKEGIVTYISPVLERSRSGFTENEILGTHFSKNVHPEDLDMVIRKVESIMSGNVEAFEYRTTNKSGEVLWVRDSIRPIVKDEEVVGFQGVLRDITESKKAQQDVYNIFNLSTDLLCVLDLSTNHLVKVNPSFKSVLGYESSELLSRPYKEFIHPNDVQKTESHLKGELEDAMHLHYFENRVLGKDGKYRWFGWSYTPIYEEGMVYGVGRDISEQKAKEKELLRHLMNYKVDEGNIYCATEPEPDKSLETFKDLLEVGYEGMIISRTPQRDFEQYIEKDFDFIWLAESEMEETIPPDLTKIEEEFNKLPKNEVVLMDRLDYLITKNDFDKTLSFIQNIRELSYLKDLIVIFSIDPVTISEKENALLEKECQTLKPIHETMISSDLLDIMKYIYKRKLENVSPSYDNLIKELEISRPTARKRIISLINLGYLTEKKKGREKVFEFTDKGRALFR
jgi:PAS domain S-box-containing protein